MSDLTLPPDYAPTLPEAARREINMVKLAREIAMDLRGLQEILEHHCVSQRDFEVLKRNPHFCRVLSSEIEAWQSATNTQQRVRLKSASMMEEFLPELYRRLIDPKEDLMKVTKGAELVTKLSGLGAEEAKDNDPSNRVMITINMGADNKLQVAKSLPPKVIDHENVITEQVTGLADELQQNLFELSLETASDGNINQL